MLMGRFIEGVDRGQVTLFPDRRSAGRSGCSPHRPPLLNFFMTRYTASYAGEIAAFIDCIVNDKPASPSGADGITALRLADACERSVSEGQRITL